MSNPTPSAFPTRPGHLASLIQVGQIPPEELEQRLEEFRVLVGPFASRDDLIRHINQSRGRVHWAFNSFARQQVTDVIKAQAAAAAVTPVTPVTSQSSEGGAGQVRPGMSLAGTARSMPTVPMPLPSAALTAAVTAAAPPPVMFSAVVAPAASSSPIVKDVFTEEDEGSSSSSSTKPAAANPAVKPAPAPAPAPVEIPFVGAVLSGGEEAGALPTELLFLVFSFLGYRELVKASSVCKQWRRLSNDELLWKRLTTTRWRPPPPDQPLAVVSDLFLLFPIG